MGYAAATGPPGLLVLPEPASGPRAIALATGACMAHDDLSLCGLEARLRDDRFAGDLVVALTIDARGLVTAARGVGGSANDPELAPCVIAALKKRTFDVDARGEARLELDWLARHEVDEVIESGTEIEGAIAPEEIKRAIRARRAALLSCYAAGRLRNDKLAGTVLTRFVVDSAGLPREVASYERTLQDPQVVRCVEGIFGKIVFPAPTKGTVRVTYPLDFQHDWVD